MFASRCSVYDNATLQQYVNEIGQRLAKASDRPGFDYHFLVVDSPEVNAFALPGGHTAASSLIST